MGLTIIIIIRVVFWYFITTIFRTFTSAYTSTTCHVTTFPS